jgi:SRI (Set2 Rpb1 interacting) domain
VSAVVLKQLTAHLKEKRISKEQFKGLAKKITHQLCEKQYRRHRDYMITPSLDSAVKTYVKDYMKKYYKRRDE